MEIEIFYQREGEPWLVFTRGHVNLNDFVTAVKRTAVGYGLLLEGQYTTKAEKLYIVDEGGEQNYQFCDKYAKGSFPITGYKF